ncbi:unnamed protein product [Dicrocoelium dendriticum]|nr:unnamed protein product [Dicrocoelium dendriticum]
MLHLLSRNSICSFLHQTKGMKLLTVFGLCLAFISVIEAYSRWPYEHRLRKGVATFTTPYEGQVTFTPVGTSALRVSGRVSGLPPMQKVGVHIHETGNLGNGCLDAGAHWNPFNRNHGDLNSRVRHEGDFGNLETDRSGNMLFDFTAPVDRRDITNGFIGLTLVIHEKTDDLGLKDNEGSRTTGNSGGRMACAVVGLAEKPVVHDSRK